MKEFCTFTTVCRKFLLIGLILGFAATANAGTFIDKNGFKASFAIEAAIFGIYSENTNYGAGQDYDSTTDGDKDITWGEYFIKPSIDISWNLDGSGSMYGRFALVTEGIRGDGDVYGGNSDGADYTDIDNLYVGWKSGAMFATENFLDISVGRQALPIGRSFVVKKQQGDDPASYWLGPLTHFENTAVVRVNSSPVRADFMYFKAVEGGNNTTDVFGANFEYTNDTFGNGSDATLAFMYLNIFESDAANRDGMNVFSLRSGFAPLGAMGNKDLSIYLEYVLEDNNDDVNEVDANAYWAEIAYTFSKVKYSPKVLYSYYHFGGGSETKDIYDPLFWSSNGWGTGYSEIWGDNSWWGQNENRHTFQVEATFGDTLTAGMAYQIFLRDDKNGADGYGVTADDDIGNEFVLYADYGVTDWLWIGGCYAIGEPGDAGEAMIGGDETNQKIELYAYFYF